MGTNGDKVPDIAGKLENANKETIIAVRDMLQATPSKKGKLLAEIRATTKIKTQQEIIDDMLENGSLLTRDAVACMIDQERKYILSLVAKELHLLRNSVAQATRKNQDEWEDAKNMVIELKRTMGTFQKNSHVQEKNRKRLKCYDKNTDNVEGATMPSSCSSARILSLQQSCSACRFGVCEKHKRWDVLLEQLEA